MKKRKTKVSKATAALLSEGESGHADFKRIPDNVSAEDLVAFANAKTGGSLLIGIEEKGGPAGAQIGVVIGCDVSDGAILQITNKAISCIPPVAIKVSIEAQEAMPFLRVDISSSETKPHCTPKGIYCVRDGRRNRPLHPPELLKIFLESEARAFSERFQSSANDITASLSSLESSLEGRIDSMASSLGWSDSKLDDTESAISSVLQYVRKINDDANDISTRLRALFRQDKRDDPVRQKARDELLKKVIAQLEQNPALLKKLEGGASVEMKATGSAAVEMGHDDFKSVLSEAMKTASKSKK